MQRAKILGMNRSTTSLPRGQRRDQRLAPVRTQDPERGDRHRGRAWINGREVGGTAQRFAHLTVGHD